MPRSSARRETSEPGADSGGSGQNRPGLLFLRKTLHRIFGLASGAAISLRLYCSLFVLVAATGAAVATDEMDHREALGPTSLGQRARKRQPRQPGILPWRAAVDRQWHRHGTSRKRPKRLPALHPPHGGKRKKGITARPSPQHEPGRAKRWLRAVAALYKPQRIPSHRSDPHAPMHDIQLDSRKRSRVRQGAEPPPARRRNPRRSSRRRT